MKKFFILPLIILLSVIALPHIIYSLQQNIIINGNFTGGSSTGWTYTETDSDSTAISNFATTGGNNDAGVWYLQVRDNSNTIIYTAEANLTNDGGSWTNPGTLTSATALFSYKQTWATGAPTTNTIKVFLIKPDNSEVLLFTRLSTASDSVYSSEVIDVGVGNFTQSGAYKLKLYNYIVTPIGRSTVKNYWDDVDIILIYYENPPIITTQAPQNITYNTNYVWANLTLDKDGSWCGYSLDNTANVSMTNSSGNWNSLVESIAESSHNITFSCNDTSGNMNASGAIIYFSIDTTFPQYSLNQTNSTASGQPTLFSLYWTDNNLEGFIFSFDNGTGTFTNDTYTIMTGVGNWSNVTKTINSAVGTTIRWKVYTNDTSNNMNTSIEYSFITTGGGVDNPPEIYAQSPANTTYFNKTIDLNVSANEAIDTWQYSLNGASNITFSPNTTITVIAGLNNIAIYANDTAGNWNSTTVYFTLNTTLEVNISEPSTLITTNIIQNTTFIINATVICRQGSCGDVSATIRYNKTTSNPDTAINITSGANPFYVDEATPLSTKSCPSNPLTETEFCNLTWTINATDTTLSSWKIDANFSSNSGWTLANETSDSTIKVNPCSVDITVNWNIIEFNNPLNPNTYKNPALGNNGNEYNITINEGSCNTDLYIKSTDMETIENNYILGVGNLTWSNTSNIYSTSYNMTTTYAPLKIDVAQNTNITTWYWINVPPFFAANYNGTTYIQGVQNGDTPP